MELDAHSLMVNMNWDNLNHKINSNPLWVDIWCLLICKEWECSDNKCKWIHQWWVVTNSLLWWISWREWAVLKANLWEECLHKWYQVAFQVSNSPSNHNKCKHLLRLDLPSQHNKPALMERLCQWNKYVKYIFMTTLQRSTTWLEKQATWSIKVKMTRQWKSF